MKLTWEPTEMAGGLSVGYGYDAVEDELVVVQQSDCTAIVEANRRRFRETDPFKRAGEDFHLMARIPPGIAMKWKLELGVDIMKQEDWPKIMKLLHDPDWSYLRTHGGSYLDRPAREYFKASTSTGKIQDKFGPTGGREGRVRRKGGL
jgi:hypothetical protein